MLELEGAYRTNFSVSSYGQCVYLKDHGYNWGRGLKEDLDLQTSVHQLHFHLATSARVLLLLSIYMWGLCLLFLLGKGFSSKTIFQKYFTNGETEVWRG